MVISIYCRFTGYNFQKILYSLIFLFLKIDFVLANSGDPDEMRHFRLFHLGLRCLQKYLFRGFSLKRVNLNSFGTDVLLQLSSTSTV